MQNFKTASAGISHRFFYLLMVGGEIGIFIPSFGKSSNSAHNGRLRNTDHQIKKWFKALFVALRPNKGNGLVSNEGFKITHNHAPQAVDSSERVISSSQRTLISEYSHSQTFIPSAGFEPTIPVGDRPQTHALETAQLLGSAKSNLPTTKAIYLLRNRKGRHRVQEFRC
jgi:hypothetical protein